MLGVLVASLPWGSVSGQTDGVSPLSGPEQEFLERHWRQPLPPQGRPPARFSPIERSLSPADCGTCHPVQFADWRTSIHAKTMGPGVAGQLVEMARTDPASARTCPSCHAPLAEQSAELRRAREWVANPAFDPALRQQGVVCASCHVRGHQRFGPPRRDGTVGDLTPRGRLPHNGVTRSPVYLRSEFCASCHQFAPNGLALNGKPLQNTYEEWRQSPAAARGLQCQDCHMPDRRHLWRGIHDPEMVRSAVEISLATERARHAPGDELRATLTVANTGVGHFFPTYVTPRVAVRMELVDSAGASIPGSIEERAIAREVPPDLSREISDTRIAPGGRLEVMYRRRIERAGLVLRATVTVYPDHFYTGFFEALLAQGAGAGTSQIRGALAATRSSSFVIFSEARELR